MKGIEREGGLLRKIKAITTDVLKSGAFRLVRGVKRFSSEGEPIWLLYPCEVAYIAIR